MMKNSAEIIATKVHGGSYSHGNCHYSGCIGRCSDGVMHVSCGKCGLSEIYDPENNDTQAREALEAWCRKEGSRDANLEYDGEWWSVLLNEDEEDRHRNWYPKCKADVTNKSLSAAIVEAICSAVGEGK